MTRHVVDINLAYTITKRKIYTNVEYNFHDRCTYLTLQAVFFLFSADNFHDTMNYCGNATNSKQVDLRHSRGVNMFYFFGSEFSRHPEGLSFSGLSFRDI